MNTRASYTPNDILNLCIVAGLFGIAFITIISMAVIYSRTHQVQSEFVLIVSNIASGMVGFLSREYKLPGSNNNISTDKVESLNVTNEAPAPDDKTSEAQKK